MCLLENYVTFTAWCLQVWEHKICFILTNTFFFFFSSQAPCGFFGNAFQKHTRHLLCVLLSSLCVGSLFQTESVSCFMTGFLAPKLLFLSLSAPAVELPETTGQDWDEIFVGLRCLRERPRRQGRQALSLAIYALEAVGSSVSPGSPILDSSFPSSASKPAAWPELLSC